MFKSRLLSGITFLFISLVVLSNAYAQSYHAVIAGVADYPGVFNDLSYTDDDAIDMRNSLLLYSNWEEGNIELLLDSDATKTGIESAISNIAAVASPDDVCLFFFSGHGTNSTDKIPLDELDNRDEYLCSYGSSIDEFIRDDELSEWLDELPTTKVVVIIDTCYSGGIIKSDDSFSLKALPGTEDAVHKSDGFVSDIRNRVKSRDMNDNAGCVVLTACDDDELSVETPILQNGLFTYFVISALEKNRDMNLNDELSAEEIGKFSRLRVNFISWLPLFGIDQHPQIYDDYPSNMPMRVELPVGIGIPQIDYIVHDENIAQTFRSPAILNNTSALMQNYPNPFNPETWIPYRLKENANVIIEIHEVTGKLIRKLDLGYKQSGFYISRYDAAYWDGKDKNGEKVSSGLYFYTIRAGNFIDTRKMVIAQ
jgi:hypothetical protein